MPRTKPNPPKRPPLLDAAQTVSLLVFGAFVVYLVWRLMQP